MIACLSPIMQRHQAVRNFAFWLRHYVKSSSGDPIRTEVNQLSSVSGNVTEAMQKASELISRHSDRFAIPNHDGQTTTAGIFHLLQNEWNLFHQSAATSHSPVLEQSKHLITVKSDNGLASILRNKPDRQSKPKYAGRSVKSAIILAHSYPITPLAIGMAMGAP